MRLFVALDIDDAIRDRIARFLDGVRGFAPDARWVRPESLHVTLKFIGEQARGSRLRKSSGRWQTIAADHVRNELSRLRILSQRASAASLLDRN